MRLKRVSSLNINSTLNHYTLTLFLGEFGAGPGVSVRVEKVLVYGF